MIAALESIQRFTEGMSLEQFRASPMVSAAVLYQFVVIGEAARSMPEEIVARHPLLNWNRMRGMRNAMVHEYFGADLGIVRQTIQEDLPPLAPRLRTILEREG